MNYTPGNRPSVQPETLRPWQTDPVVLRILRNAGYLPRRGPDGAKLD